MRTPIKNRKWTKIAWDCAQGSWLLSCRHITKYLSLIKKLLRIPSTMYTGIECLAEKISSYINDPTKPKQGKKYKKQKPCDICQQKFNGKFNEVENYHRVWDHCHYTEEFRGATHSICNLRHKTLQNILVVFYNGSNYTITS